MMFAFPIIFRRKRHFDSGQTYAIAIFAFGTLDVLVIVGMIYQLISASQLDQSISNALCLSLSMAPISSMIAGAYLRSDKYPEKNPIAKLVKLYLALYPVSIMPAIFMQAFPMIRSNMSMGSSIWVVLVAYFIIPGYTMAVTSLRPKWRTQGTILNKYQLSALAGGFMTLFGAFIGLGLMNATLKFLEEASLLFSTVALISSSLVVLSVAWGGVKNAPSQSTMPDQGIATPKQVSSSEFGTDVKQTEEKEREIYETLVKLIMDKQPVKEVNPNQCTNCFSTFMNADEKICRFCGRPRMVVNQGQSTSQPIHGSSSDRPREASTWQPVGGQSQPSSDQISPFSIHARWYTCPVCNNRFTEVIGGRGICPSCIGFASEKEKAYLVEWEVNGYAWNGGKMDRLTRLKQAGQEGMCLCCLFSIGIFLLLMGAWVASGRYPDFGYGALILGAVILLPLLATVLVKTVKKYRRIKPMLVFWKRFILRLKRRRAEAMGLPVDAEPPIQAAGVSSLGQSKPKQEIPANVKVSASSQVHTSDNIKDRRIPELTEEDWTVVQQQVNEKFGKGASNSAKRPSTPQTPSPSINISEQPKLSTPTYAPPASSISHLDSGTKQSSSTEQSKPSKKIKESKNANIVSVLDLQKTKERPQKCPACGHSMKDRRCRSCKVAWCSNCGTWNPPEAERCVSCNFILPST